MNGACDGLRVIDFSFWMAGPLATMVLADNGAEVIKVEPPDGDPARDLAAFQAWNRGKKSIVLDLKTSEGRQRAMQLVRTADVAVIAFRPGVAERLGIDYQDVHAVNPSAVYAAITGYGEKAKYRHLKGYETLVSAKSGRMMSFENVADRPGPGCTAVPLASYAAAMATVQGILAALHTRRETGQGQKVSVSLLGALMPYDIVQWIGLQLAEREPEEEKQRQFEAQRGIYHQRQMVRTTIRVPRPNFLTAMTRDGVWLQFANTMDHLCLAQMQALDLLDLYGQERFAKLPAVFSEADAEALWEIVLEQVRSKTHEEWARIFNDYENIAVERIRRPLESMEHRQAIHNGHAVRVPGLQDQRTLQPGPIARFSESQVCIGQRAPHRSEHTGQVLQSLDNAAPAKAGTSLRAPGGEGNSDRKGPLSDVTIVDFSMWVQAPQGVTLLANLGARVIKVEMIGGDHSRYSTGGLLAFEMTQGKQSIAVDLKHPEGRQIAHQLIAKADILVHNFRAGVPERLGLDYHTCRRLNPSLIYMNAASYGDSGPDCRRPAFMATAAAIGGNSLRQVGASHPPPESQNLSLEELKQEAWRLAKAAEGNADPTAALGMATALMLGLHARDASGVGQSLLTTMMGTNMYANSDEVIGYEGRPPARSLDDDLLGYGPLHRLYEASEGWVFLACLRRAEWLAFCQAANRPSLASNWEVGCRANMESGEAKALAAAIAEILRSRSAPEWEQLMAQHDVPLVAVEMRDPGSFSVEDEVMKENEYMVEVESPVHDRYWRHGALQQFSGEELNLGPWEPIGGHTRPIMSELGYSDEEVDGLIAKTIVEAWSPSGQ
jgi:crotonobetainyl-CoA:carnitine CoA-transferase CaiB-like acyl-CoA transferase